MKWRGAQNHRFQYSKNISWHGPLARQAFGAGGLPLTLNPGPWPEALAQPSSALCRGAPFFGPWSLVWGCLGLEAIVGGSWGCWWGALGPGTPWPGGLAPGLDHGALWQAWTPHRNLRGQGQGAPAGGAQQTLNPKP